MRRDVFMGIGAGLLSALLWASVASRVPGGLIFAYMAPLPLMAAGLTLGPRTAAIGGIAAVAVAAFAGSGWFGFVLGVTVALPSYAVVRAALFNRNGPGGITEWFAPGDILARLAAIGAGLVAAAGIIHFDVPGGLPGALHGYLDQILQIGFGVSGADERAALVQRLLPWLPAAVAASWILQLAVNAVLAQAMLKRSGRNIRPSPAYSALDVPEWLYWTTVAAAGVALISSGTTQYVARNMVMVLATPFFFVGLAIVHTMVRRLTLPGMALTVFYMILYFTFGWGAVAVAGLGFFEHWAELRQRLGQSMGSSGGPRPADEEEE